MTRYNITEFDTLSPVDGSAFVYVATASGSVKNYKLTLTALSSWIGGGGGSVSWGGIGGTLSAQTDLQTALNLKANLASPALTGTPTAPTAAPGTNSTQLATTAYADAIAALKANLASPTFTGVPAAPTAAVDTNTTQLATTAYVIGQAAAATPLAIGTAAVGASTRYARADHVHNTPMTTSQDIIVGGASGVATRLAVGANGTFLGVTAGSIGWTTPSGSGDVVGPASAVDGRVVAFDGTTGKLIKQDTRLAADLVAGPASSTNARVAVWNGAGGKTLQDGTKLEADLATGPASATSGNLPSFNGTGGKTLQDSGVLAASVVVGPASVVTGRVASYNGTTGKLIADGGILVADVVTGPASATSARVATFNGTSGKVIQDGGVLLSNIPTMASNAGASGRVLTSAGADKTVQDSGTLLSALAPLASPTFTGTPAAPTAALGTNTTQVATTAFVQQEKGTVLTSFSAAYPIVLADANSILLHPSSDTTARTVTIPANASVAFPIGTMITIDNQVSAGALTIAITTDTLEWVGTGATGSRTVAAAGQCTIMKITSTRWRLSGVGVT